MAEGIPQGLKPASVAEFDAKAKALAYLEARGSQAEDFGPEALQAGRVFGGAADALRYRAGA
jgi:hypothetical protein